MGYKYTPTQEILNKNILTERDISNLRKRLNGYSKSREEAGANNYEWKEEYKITAEQTEKGRAWLLDQAFKPSRLQEVLSNRKFSGADLRKSQPFGNRELEILIDFSHFTFTGLFDAGTPYQNNMGYYNYLPIYKVHDTEGYTFEYYVMGGEIHLIG